MHLPQALHPLRDAVYRGLWFAWLGANLTMWMNDVAAAWLMTSLTTSPVLIALVATASSLPVFLLALPSGAVADIVDRRRYFAATQLWVAVVALVQAVLALGGHITPELLVLLTFLNGVGLAMRWPVFAAIVPQVVPREHLQAALGLGGISMNLSRVVGPMVAGGLLAGAGPTAVFLLNAVVAGACFVLILRWHSPVRTSTLPGERFVGAVRAGLNYAMQAPRLRIVLLRIFMFFLQSTALTALLPLVAQRTQGGGPGLFTLMLSAMGLGAVLAVMLFPRWRERFDRDQFVLYGSLVHAAMACLVVTVPVWWVVLPAMVGLGMAWISVANSLNMAAQTAMPDWVRARGMAIYQMALMGGATAGSLLWGQVAKWTNVSMAVGLAAAVGCLSLLLTRHLSVQGEREPDFSPALAGPVAAPALEIAPDQGPVMVTVEYRIEPARAAEFALVMQRTRRARLRQGALSWGLFQDVAVPGLYVEYFVDENWVEHLRRLERFTAFDAELRTERLAFHVGQQLPLVRRYVGDTQTTLGAVPAL